MRTIYYESDFKIREQRKDGTPMWNAPFRFTYYVKMSRGTFVASYDGREFINCHKGTGEDEGKLIVAFDSPQFGTGVLRVKREFFLNDSDFMDGVRHYVSDESTDVVLDKGATTEGVAVDTVFNPSYYKGDKGDQGDSAYQVWLNAGNEGSIEDFLDSLKGEDGKDGVDGKDGADGAKGDKGDPLTYDDLTGEDKDDLASHIQVSKGSITEDKLSQEVQDKLNQNGGSGVSLIEVTNNPKGIPSDNTIAINTSNEKVFFGIANKGWWFVTAQMLGSAEIDGDTLKISAEYDNGTISVSGEVKDGLLIL